MTEDILFDNIYVGHSVEDAKKLASETFEVKKPLEVAADKPAEDESDDDSVSFKEDPIEWIRSRLFDFIDTAKSDPAAAFKTQPEVGVVFVGLLFSLFGMIGALFGLVGGASKPVITKSSKKTDAPSPDDKKKTETAPVAPAGETKKEEEKVKRRK